MARKIRNVQDVPSDDDIPEVVSHSISKADAKRSQKALRDFEAEEKVRKKVRNRERDQKLKERARATRNGKKPKGIQILDGDDEGDSSVDEGGDNDDLEARMLRAMRDAANEMESGEEDMGDDEADSEDGDFDGFGQEMDLGDDLASDDSMAQEALTEDEEMDESKDEEDETTLPQTKAHRSKKKAAYLADDLFKAAFSSQNPKSAAERNIKSTQQQATKKRRRKSNPRPKDIVIGGRTIRTLSRLSDPQSQATARSVPSARARRFIDHSLALKGKRALLKAKKKGWERRPANVGVMKHQGAPHGFVRCSR